MWTLSLLTVERGSSTELPCGYDHEVNTVFWRKENSSAVDAEQIATLYSNGSRIGHPGFDTRRFDITSNYSLVINDVRLEDEGLYFCQVLDSALDETFGNYTYVKVNSGNIDTFLTLTGRS